MEITKNNLKQAISALRQCAKENEGRNIDTHKIRISDLCNDVASYLEKEWENIESMREEIEEMYRGRIGKA